MSCHAEGGERGSVRGAGPADTPTSGAQLVRTLLDAPLLDSGVHELGIDGRGERGRMLASGVYFYRVETPEGATRGRVAILK